MWGEGVPIFTYKTQRNECFWYLCQTCRMQRAESLRVIPLAKFTNTSRMQPWLNILRDFSLYVTPTDSLRDTRNFVSFLHIHAGLGAHITWTENSIHQTWLQMTNFRCLQKSGVLCLSKKHTLYKFSHCRNPKNDSHKLLGMSQWSALSKKKKKNTHTHTHTYIYIYIK